MRRISLLLLLAFGSFKTTAQGAPDVDSVHMLLLNPYVQIEATQAINQMYNFKWKVRYFMPIHKY